jgi:hypothetical protein
MNPRMLFSAAMATMSLILALGCSHAPAKKKSHETSSEETKASSVIGAHYTTVLFEQGKARLSRDGKELIKSLVSKAHESDKEIEEIHILAWADKEYPEQGNKAASTQDTILASARGQQIREFLEEDLNESEDIDSFNMARRPDFLSRLLRDDEYEIKKSFETTGATSSILSDGSVSFTKASKALVIINYRGDENNLK